jgi:RNA polymerase sigma-70 factor (ECF subfamily)
VAYVLLFDAVARYCLRRIPEHLANDAVSEVFLTAWRRAESMPSGDEALPWLYGVAKNVIRNSERSLRRRTRLRHKVMSEPRYPEQGLDVQFVRKEQDAELFAALKRLKPEDQEVLRLRAYEGLTMAQISIAVGCSEEAAKKRVSRALNRLRKATSIDNPVPIGNDPRAIHQGGEG